MIVVTGHFRIPLGSLAAARDAMARVIDATRSEAGCLSYSYSEDMLEPGLFRVCECWTDRQALSAHFEQPHMRLWKEERARLGMTDREVIAHEISTSEAI